MNLGKRYAKALFQIGMGNGNLDLYVQQLRALEDIFKHNDDLRRFFLDEFVDKTKKTAVLTNVCKRIDFTPEIIRLINLIINNDRANIYDDMVSIFEYMYNDFKGLIKVDIYTAYDIDNNETGNVKSRIKELFNKDPILNIKHDKTIISGMKLQIGWTVYDGTIKSNLKDFTDSIKI
ncbi:MAG: ATP synthase F1 subunit delta [Deltaproteobacteria bacterium]|nr:ATP synthase F1 subunit delta [Deltaproteobacteria bacterium]MCL5791927.1 ATP synthase F1 subunit delta [Deltaproteobacteria bacterium]